MNDHPLTDEMCEILSRQPWLDPDVDVEGTAYDMRAAADWQLEQVIQSWEQCMEEPGTDIQVIRRFEQKLKAMRPQIVDLPQANSDVCGEEGIERARQRTFEENDELLRKLSDS